MPLNSRLAYPTVSLVDLHRDVQEAPQTGNVRNRPFFLPLCSSLPSLPCGAWHASSSLRSLLLVTSSETPPLSIPAEILPTWPAPPPCFSPASFAPREQGSYLSYHYVLNTSKDARLIMGVGYILSKERKTKWMNQWKEKNETMNRVC